MAERADFLGAIRLPSDAFKREGTRVVTDIVFLRKRAPGEPAHHADPDWLAITPLAIEGGRIPINRYFLNHPEMVLGTFSRKDRLRRHGYSVNGNGELAAQLDAAIRRLPEAAPQPAAAQAKRPTRLHPAAAGAAHRRRQLLHRRRPQPSARWRTARPSR